jgi:serine/threonine-protein kinase
MNVERWQQIDDLFHAALACNPGQRAEFLATRCRGDEPLRREVESLLSSHESADDFIENPVGDVAAEMLGTHQTGLAPGHQIENYRIVRPLGAGGMGEVYLAEDVKLKRKVALKLLPSHFTINPDRVRRFEREARAASALNHPNIVTIYEIKQSGSTHFIATEFVDGKTLRQIMNEKPLKLSEILNVAIQVADALSGAHAAGIVHRDIKPENIMIHRQGYVKVLDFGLAKLNEQPGLDSDADKTTLLQSNPGLVMGTVQYMSPEQARGKKVDARADIWSLGVVLFELLAGRVPFEGETPSHVMVALMENELPSVSNYVNASPELERIVTKTLRKQAKERYQSARDLARDLKEIKQQLQVEEHLRRFGEPVRPPGATSLPQQTLTRATAAAVMQGVQTQSHVSSAEYLVRQVSRHKVAVTIAALLLLTVSVVGSYFYFAKKPTIRSIAVLPFNNGGNNPDMEYLSDGLSESLTNNLSPVPGLMVISRYSSFRYKGKQPDPQEVGKSLGVDAIVTGSVNKVGDNYLISVELVSASDRRQIWGTQYNRKITDLLIVQSEISREIAEQLRLRLTKTEEQQLAKTQAINPQAYDLFLKARALRHTGKTADRKKAVEYYQQAVAVEPNYALAYADLAIFYSGLITNNELPQKEFAPKAEDAAQKAVQADNDLAESHLAVAIIEMNKWEWSAAEAEFKKALELNPNLVAAHREYGVFLRIHGRVDEAVAEINRAQQLDPLRISVAQARVTILAIYRQNDQALEGAKQLLQLDPQNPAAHIRVAVFYDRVGRNAEAIASYQEAIKLGDDSGDAQGLLACAYARNGQRDKALDILRQFEAGKLYSSPVGLGMIHLALGDKARFYAALEDAYAMHDQQLIWLRGAWEYDAIRSEPRFQDLIRRVGL